MVIRTIRLVLMPALLLGIILTGVQASRAAPPLEVCATIPDLGSLAKEIGGDQVKVTVFAKGPQDAHFMQARPSFIKALSRADLFLQAGLDLELAWVPRLLQGARNANVLLGASGFLDASTAITPLEKPAGLIDRSLGDVHPLGNPHYLLDPVNGLLVARAIRDRLSPPVAQVWPVPSPGARVFGRWHDRESFSRACDPAGVAELRSAWQ